ncbi:diguanylate cyclase [Massilia sp. WF1]|uniref:bifunctional diguanylate cyclase/phosphodiesterase n=1 Tax=unclassified Massilia TaxID=2609279 RepID=UPI000649E398|nr:MULTISPECIES: EAL domain-containing protein [unclassified Massilia]ALK99095.1 diguanylate cyclase [Massilia sp. WG5]KLU36031.1 diguanylate cyclase [Massilia sp. WF1]
MSKPSTHTAPRTHRFLALLWPALALLACAALWTAAVLRANAEHRRADEQAFKEADAYAEAYEQYVTRSLAQMDQITMQLKHSWEHSHNRALVEDMRRDGMFTDSAFVAVSVIGRGGRLASSSGLRLAEGASLAAAGFFVHHRDNNSSALRIAMPPPELAALRGTVLFTRRLDTADDEFGGVLLMAVDAAYFTSFVSAATLGAHSLLALVGVDGNLRIEQDSSGIVRLDARASLLPANAERWPVARGVQLVDAGAGPASFGDGRARVLGWSRANAYPVVALVALSHEAALAGADAYWRDSRTYTSMATVVLLLASGIASMLSLRAAARAREQDEVARAYRTATESGNDGFYMVSPLRDRKKQVQDFRIVDCNERGAFFYGMTRDSLVGSLISELHRDLGAAELIAHYRQALATGFYQEDRRMPDDNRLNIRWGHRRLVRVGDGLAVTLQDISERKEHEAQLARLANEDSLTGLPNRHWFLHFVPGALAHAELTGKGVALLFIDLDEFKQVNDSHGHAVGDRLLKAAATRLLSQLRPSDRVARFGGDEFIVLLSPFDNDEQVGMVAQRIIQAFGKPFEIAEEQHVIGASVGISVFPRDGQDAATLIRHSDIAMYAGKNEGKGQYRFFDPAQSSTLKTRAQLRQRLLEAIDKRQFVLHYQPRVDTRSGELLSMEALLRWEHPQLGMIRPDEFIPLAESSGLIVPIGAIVIDRACAQLAAWSAGGAPVAPVSINVSPKQFLRGGVRRELAEALGRHGVAPALLEVEITESAMMGDQDEILAELAAIRALGVKLHVDDFGTGYSSLSQLQRMKMDVLKVDRSFTAELGRSKEGTVFFQAIVSMAHALGMEVVAEGVENAEQLAILRTLGCNEVQGYLVARPMPADDMAALLAQRYLFDDKLAA